jgi:succinate-semialdehyde dehydrogenase/glutarate-semialdehyde dehydrogenase
MAKSVYKKTLRGTAVVRSESSRRETRKSNHSPRPGVASTVLSINPATGKLLHEYAAASVVEVAEAVEGARRAQPAWASLSLRERCKHMEALRHRIYSKRTEIAQQLIQECGKPLAEALSNEIVIVLDIARFCIRHAEKILKPRRVPHQNIALKLKKGRQTYEPYGVVAVISPWNFPFQLALVQIIPALIAGNCVVHKPSEYTSGIGVLMRELFAQAGFPENVFQVVIGDGATGAALADGAIDKVAFTGSVATGKKIVAAAAQKLTPVTLELGGSDPFIVLRDANLEHAASGAVWGRFMNCGQSCVAPKRIIVEREVYEPFVFQLVEKAKQLRLGNAEDAETDVGPMIRETQLITLQHQLEDAKAKGAKILCGGKRRPDLGPLFFEPTVFVDVKPSMLVMQEETFGPLLPIISVRDADEAVQIANASSFGLSASVWTEEVRRGREIAKRLQAGVVLINDLMSHTGMCNAPRTGVKMSGLGYTNGVEGLLEMVRIKYVDSDAMTAFRKPWWFRYTPKQAKNLESFVGFLHAPTWRERLAAIPGALALLFDKERI